MNTKRKGSIAVAAAILYFTDKSYTVLLPISDCDKYDIVVDDGSLKKVQCKYTSQRPNKSSYYIDLRTYGGYRDKVYSSHYKNGDFDYLFILCENGNMYLIPASVIIEKDTITVGNIYEEYKI